LLAAAQAAGCKTANGGHMVEAVQDVMADFMLDSQPQRAT
jgi:shikimate dehydrogenase